MSDDIKLVDLEGGEILYNDLRERIENKKGIPKGGQTGQVLTKSSNKDYAAVWRTPKVIKDIIVDGESVLQGDKAYIETALAHFPGESNFRVDKNNNNFSTGSYATAEGTGTTASSRAAHAEGVDTIASASGAHAEGHATHATGSSAHAEGFLTIANVDAHAEGYSTKATGRATHAEGRLTEASGEYSHAEGEGTKASGQSSHAEGEYTIASGNYSHTEGTNNTASGSASHTEGQLTQARGDNSHAEGYQTVTYGRASHAQGCSTIINGDYSSVFGTYNIPDTRNYTEWVGGKNYKVGDRVKITYSGSTPVGYFICIIANSDVNFNYEHWQGTNTYDYIEVVGNGAAENARSNARTLDWQGNEWVAGKVSAGTVASPASVTAANDLTTKAYVDAAVSSITVPVQDVQIGNTSILHDGIASIPVASTSTPGVFAIGSGLKIINEHFVVADRAAASVIKTGTSTDKLLTAQNTHYVTFYGLAKAAGDTTQSQSDNAVGTYTDSAKTAIQQMLGVPSTSAVTSEIAAAIGNINSFDMSIVQALPTENISTHTIYLVPKTGETNDVYDEYVYINNGWEMVGNTQIDLSNYVQKTEYATSTTAGVVKVNSAFGVNVNQAGFIALAPASDSDIRYWSTSTRTITPATQHAAVFYGLARAAGDLTQPPSDNAVGTYTTEAKAAIQQMLDVPSTSDIPDTSIYATKADTVLETSLSRGRKANTTIGVGSFAFGEDVEARGDYSFAIGRNTQAVGAYGHAEGVQTYAASGAHAEGISTKASIAGAHTEGYMTYARGSYASHSEGYMTNALGLTSHSEGLYTLATADTAHSEGYGTAAIGYFSHSSGEGYIGYLSISGPENTVNYTYNYAANDPEFVITKGSLVFLAQSNKWTYISDIDSVNKIITVTRTLGAALENQSVRLIDNIAYGTASSVSGLHNVANGYYQQVTGIFSSSESQYSIWTPNTQYYIGDCISSPVGVGYQCIVDNNDEQFDEAHWKRIIYNTEHIYIIGNGTANDARSNAYALDWSGNGHYAGNVYVGANADSTGGTKVLCEADFATDLEIQNIINGGASA